MKTMMTIDNLKSMECKLKPNKTFTVEVTESYGRYEYKYTLEIKELEIYAFTNDVQLGINELRLDIVDLYNHYKDLKSNKMGKTVNMWKDILVDKIEPVVSIEQNTLIRVWGEDYNDNNIIKFERFDCSRGVRRVVTSSGRYWDNYELIDNNEINPNVRK